MLHHPEIRLLTDLSTYIRFRFISSIEQLIVIFGNTTNPILEASLKNKEKRAQVTGSHLWARSPKRIENRIKGFFSTV